MTRKLILIYLLLLLVIVSFIIKKNKDNNINQNIIEDYYKKEQCHRVEWQYLSDFDVYYYEEKDDIFFINNDKYALINEENIELVKDLFEYDTLPFKEKKCNDLQRKFDINLINYSNYISIWQDEDYEFIVYLYDISNHVLYYKRVFG